MTRSRSRARSTSMQDGLLRPDDLPVGLEPALALRMPARGASRREVPVAPAPHPPGDLGLPGIDDGRDDARDARRGARARLEQLARRPIDLADELPLTWATRRRMARPAPRTSRRDCIPMSLRITVLVSLRRARHGRAPPRPPRERRARGAARRHRHVGAVGRKAPVRRLPPRAGRVGPGFPDAMLDVVEREGVDVVLPAVVVRPAGARGAPRALPRAGARLAA